MTETASTRLRLRALATTGPHPLCLVPGPERLAALRDELGLMGLRKLRFEGALHPANKRDWVLEARLGATVVQPCGLTLAPVTTRIDEPVLRRYLARIAPPAGAEIEMPEDDTVEPLPDVLDLEAVMTEALVLALPPFPRAAGAAFDAPPDAGDGAGDDAPDASARPNPFAALARLRPGDQG